jgi:hypothetical protein
MGHLGQEFALFDLLYVWDTSDKSSLCFLYYPLPILSYDYEQKEILYLLVLFAMWEIILSTHTVDLDHFS